MHHILYYISYMGKNPVIILAEFRLGIDWFSCLFNQVSNHDMASYLLSHH